MSILSSSSATLSSRVIFSLDPPALIWAVSNASPSVAPPMKLLLQIFSPLGIEQKDDRDFVEQRVGELVELTTEIFGDFGNEDFRRVMVTAVGGVVPFTGQARPARPKIRVPGYEGLYLIGDGVSAGGLGGDLAANSALDAEPMLHDYLSQQEV